MTAYGNVKVWWRGGVEWISAACGDDRKSDVTTISSLIHLSRSLSISLLLCFGKCKLADESHTFSEDESGVRGGREGGRTLLVERWQSYEVVIKDRGSWFIVLFWLHSNETLPVKSLDTLDRLHIFHCSDKRSQLRFESKAQRFNVHGEFYFCRIIFWWTCNVRNFIRNSVSDLK